MVRCRENLLSQCLYLLLLLADKASLRSRRVVLVNRLHRFLHVLERLQLLLHFINFAAQFVTLLRYLIELFSRFLADRSSALFLHLLLRLRIKLLLHLRSLLLLHVKFESHPGELLFVFIVDVLQVSQLLSDRIVSVNLLDDGLVEA